MSRSLPSREIYAIDIPEISDFAAEFRYNYFTPDESVNESGGVSERFLTRPSNDIDAEFIQYSLTRAPRFVEFSFTPAKVNSLGRIVEDIDIRFGVNDKNRPEFLISENVDKIMSEDLFSSEAFVSVNFHDGEIEDKVYDLVSGSIEAHSVDEESDNDISHYAATKRLSQLIPKYVKPTYLSRFGSSLRRTNNARFFTEKEGSSRVRTLSSIRKKGSRTKTHTGRKSMMQLRSKWFDRLHDVHTHVQVNSKVLNDVIKNQMKDPNSPYGDDLDSIYDYSKDLQTSVRKQQTLMPTDEDYKTIIPFVDVKVQNTAHQTTRSSVEIVGYMIDKVEITQDGTIIDHDPIIIENPNVNKTADYRVKYGSRYKYSIRVIAQFTLPAIDDDTGDLAILKSLVSSKPSNTVYVDAQETEAPPPPADLNFTWDYENDNLLVHWVFPTNSQRDIKKFQVFRRKSLFEPFELMKMYDFDDSHYRYDDGEDASEDLIEYVTSPATFWVDDEFDKNSNQKYIYACVCIDAHGYTSNYSAQFELSFDIFKNKLTKSLVSHSGAPKAYPNLYLDRDTFVDSIKVSGPNTRSMKLYFNPEYYHLTNDQNNMIPILSTKQRGGSYEINVINLDNQKSDAISVKIDDRIKIATRKVNFPKYRFGTKRRLRSPKRIS